MFNEVMAVIEAGGYDLADLLHRIDIIYVSGKLTDEQREQLYSLARKDANPQDSLAPVLDRLDILEAWRKDVDVKLAKLEGRGPEPLEPGNEWPEYVAPTGAHDAYYNGDKVTFHGEHYTCIAPEGTPCVWDPATYPAYWNKEE